MYNIAEKQSLILIKKTQRVAEAMNKILRGGSPLKDKCK
jgi:hypothetical protein